MGLGRSKFPISFEEACQRAGDDVVNRLKDTFYRYSSNQWLLPQVTFLRDIFGDGMPPKLAEVRLPDDQSIDCCIATLRGFQRNSERDKIQRLVTWVGPVGAWDTE
jgi:hypothetical protein